MSTGKNRASHDILFQRIDFLSYIVLGNSMGKRSSPDIIATILEAANGGIGKTRLLTKANLTSAQFKKYVDLLVAKKLLAELEGPDSRPAFKTTGLGLQYLQLYSSIQSVSYLKA
jgi:predicted transcriptional regulator